MADSKEISTNICIIGAGLAGLISSFCLVKQGIPHVLLEGKKFPREKACGDIITSKAIRRLNAIDPTLIQEMKQKGWMKQIKGTILRPSSNKSIYLQFKDLDGVKNEPSCYSIQRHELDNYLLNQLKKSPLVTIHTEFQVKQLKKINQNWFIYSENTDTIKANLIIAALGSNSPLSQQLLPIEKKDKHIAVGIRAYFKGVKIEQNYGELILDKSLMPGGLYITPLSKDLFNVNLVIRKDEMQRKKIKLKETFEKLIQENSLLKIKFKDATQIGEFKGSSLFLGTQKRRLVGDGFMLIGDAAGLIDLISANGIPQAMISAKLAADQAVKCVQSNSYSKSALITYQTKLYREIKSDLAIGKMINPIFGFDFVQWISIQGLNFIANKSQKNSYLSKIFYSKYPLLNFINPAFYFRLFQESKVK